MFDRIGKDLRRWLPSGPKAGTGARVRGLLRGLGSPGFQAVVAYRVFRWARLHHIPTQPLRYCVERFVEITTGVSIPAEADFGPGLRIHHFGNIIVHPAVKVGKGCTLYHGVTLGTDGLSEKAPRVGDDVLIGAGAKVLGDIDIGDRCRIGANAVVVHSAPPGSVLVGVPARPVEAGTERPREPIDASPRSPLREPRAGRKVVQFPGGRANRSRSE